VCRPIPLLLIGALLAACAPDDGRRVSIQAEGRMLEGGFPVPMRTLSWSGDGRVLVGGDAEGRVFRFHLQRRLFTTHWPGHEAPVTAVVQRADGRLVSFGGDGAFRVTDPAHAGSAGRPSMPGAPTEAVLFDRDGTAALVWEGAETRRRPPTACEPRAAGLVLRRLSDPPRRLRLSEKALCAAFSADGRVGVLADERALRVFDAATGHFTRSIEFFEGARTQGLAISDDARRVAAVVRGALVVFHDDRPAFRVGKPVLSERGLPVRFLAGGESVLAVLPDPEESARFNLELYDASEGTLRRRLLTHVLDTTAGIAVSPDEKALAVALPDGPIRRVPLDGDAPFEDLEARHWLGAGLAAGGAYVATCSDEAVEVRAVADGALAARLAAPPRACATHRPLALDPTGRRLVLAATRDAPFVARDLDGTTVATYERPPSSEAHRPVFSRNGEWLAALVTQEWRVHVMVWPAAGGAPRWDALLPPITGAGGLAVSADGDLVVASYTHVRQDGRGTGAVSVIRRSVPQGIAWSRGHGSLAEAGEVALTPDDRRVVFASVADELLVLDVESGETLVRGANSADTVWTFARFGAVGVYSVLPALEQPGPKPPARLVSALAVDPAGTMAVVSGYNRSNRLPLLEVFDLETGALLAARGMPGHPRALFFHDGRLVAPGLPAAGGDLTTLRLGREGP
jgi:WD40 repeat protein